MTEKERRLTGTDLKDEIKFLVQNFTDNLYITTIKMAGSRVTGMMLGA